MQSSCNDQIHSKHIRPVNTTFTSSWKGEEAFQIYPQTRDISKSSIKQNIEVQDSVKTAAFVGLWAYASFVLKWTLKHQDA